MKKLAFLLVLLLLVTPVLGDMVPMGKKYVNYCATIENQADYNYNFILYGYPLADGTIINPGDCFSFYKYARPQVYAISKDYLSTEELALKLKEMQEIMRSPDFFDEEQKEEIVAKYYSGEYSLSEIQKQYPQLTMEKIKEDKYLIKNFAIVKAQNDFFNNFFEKQLIKSDLSLSIYGPVSEHDPLEKAVDKLRIAILIEDTFVLVKDRVVYTYEDGTIEEIKYTNQNEFPQPSHTTVLPYWTNMALILGAIILAFLALIFIIILVIIKIRK